MRDQKVTSFIENTLAAKRILYYGDNLKILRQKQKIDDESVDLVYLDPPFKSNQNYNLLFREQDGSNAASQIVAFEDTWTWSQEDEGVYADLVMTGDKVADVMQAFRAFIGPCDMMAYLVMMAPRLKELRRVMKATASIYLHCDPAASHYLKLLMDAVFGPGNFRNEIIWKRTSARSDSHKWNHIHDVIFFYTKTAVFTWNTQFMPYEKSYTDKFYHFIDPETGRRYASDNLTAAGTREGTSGDTWKGINVKSKGIHWKYQTETLDKLDKEGRIIWPQKTGGVPRYKRYLDEMQGLAIQSIVTDIPPLSAASAEKLGYPTQKPEALLERIIKASSNEGDLVLDPFCGCGTAIVVAQKLNRQWIGIDITYLAITVMKKRIKDTFNELGKPVQFEVIGEPVSIPDAIELSKEKDKYQFQWWALDLVDARPEPGKEKKGADKGIDGKIVFRGDVTGTFETVILSVKAGHLMANHVRDLRGVVEREKAAIGVLISMEEPTAPMRTEAATAGFHESRVWGRRYPKIQLLTIAELLNGNEIDMPPVEQVSATFKRAKKEKKTGKPIDDYVHGITPEQSIQTTRVVMLKKEDKQQQEAP